jgi:hypothetical protein
MPNMTEELFESKTYVPEFSMRITKAQYGKDNKMRLQMVASDTEADSFEEKMSLELFNNFIARRNQPVPEAFADIVCEESWRGGDPYLSLAHYRAGTNKVNVPGMVEESFIDGNYFKSKAVLEDNDLGRAIFKAINDDRYKTPEREDKIRVSIAFLDLKHKHGDLVFERNSKADKCPLCEMGVGDKTYLDGYLVHEAFTRVPANPRTSVEVQRMADNILTKKDDARSIVGDLAEGLEEKSKISGEGIVTKNDMVDPNVAVDTVVEDKTALPSPVPTNPNGNAERDYETSPDKPTDVPEIGFAASNRASTTEPDFSNEVTAHGGVPAENARVENGGSDYVAAIPYHHLNLAFESLKSAIDKAQTMEDSEEAMKSLVQPMFNKLGEEVRKACMKSYKVDKSGISTEEVRQIASEVFTQGITEQVLPLFTELKSMIAQKPATVNVPQNEVAQKRSIQLQTRSLTDIDPGASNKPQSIRQIAAKSTGLTQN